MKKHSFLCEEAIKNRQPQKMVDNTSAIARLANRVLLVAKQESDNSEDPNFINQLNRASDALQGGTPFFPGNYQMKIICGFSGCSHGPRRQICGS